MPTISNKDIFDAINSLRIEMKQDIKDLRVEVDGNTNWRNQITGKLTVLFISIGIGVNFLMDWARDKLNKPIL